MMMSWKRIGMMACAVVCMGLLMLAFADHSAQAHITAPTIVFEHNFDGTETLEDLGYVLNGSGGVMERPELSDDHSVSGDYSVSFPVSGINMRNIFDEHGLENVIFEWKVRVPANGSFAANLMQGSKSVVRTILFAGNWEYYNEAGVRTHMAPYTAEEWMTLRVEMSGDHFNAYMNDVLVGENIPTLAGEKTVNTIYYSVGSKSAYVDDIVISAKPVIENVFFDDFEGLETLEELGYVLNSSNGVTEQPGLSGNHRNSGDNNATFPVTPNPMQVQPELSDDHSVSGNYSVNFPAPMTNMRKQFVENGLSEVIFEWKVRVPANGSFAANLMHDDTSVVRTVLFDGHWAYYNEADERTNLASFTAEEWMTLRIEMSGDHFDAYMNDVLVGADIPTLSESTSVNAIYYSVGNKSAYVDDIRVDTTEHVPVEYFVTNQTELDASIDAAQAGDVITMQNGTWNDLDIVFRGVGTENNPITLQAETAGQVIISGLSSLRMAGEYLVVDGLHFKDGESSRSLNLIEFRYGSQHAHHSRLTNIAVTHFNKDRNREDSTDVWVGLFGSHNRIDHSLFEGKTSESVLMIVWRGTEEPNYHRIDNNHFKDIPSIGLGGATAIRIGDGVHALSDSFTTVESNVFENMLGIGKIINIKSGGNTIRNNTFIKASGAIALRQGNGNLIEGNYILPGLQDNYTGGILVIGEDHIIRNNYIQATRERGKAAIVLYEGEPNNYPGKGGYYPTKNITIENNTLVDNDKNILIGQYYNNTPEMIVPVENITYRGNAIVGNDSTVPVIEVLDEPIGTIIYEDNLFYNGNLTGLENIPGITIADPLLTLGEDGLYHYDASSPLKNNIIADPLSPSDVGPEWTN